jgi:hypothetical protein
VNDGGATAVVGYVRVSRVGPRGGESFLSPALHLEKIARVAAREGLEVVEVVEELDASGGNARQPGTHPFHDADGEGATLRQVSLRCP